MNFFRFVSLLKNQLLIFTRQYLRSPASGRGKEANRQLSRQKSKRTHRLLRAASGGTLIGYSDLDGRIPGYYQYASYVTIKVKAIFDYGFSVENKVREIGRAHV